MSIKGKIKERYGMRYTILAFAGPAMLEQFMQTAAATFAGNAYGANDQVQTKKLSRVFISLERPCCIKA